MIIHVDIQINGLSVCIFRFCLSFLIFRSWIFSYCNFIPGIFWIIQSLYTHSLFIWTTKSKEAAYNLSRKFGLCLQYLPLSYFILSEII